MDKKFIYIKDSNDDQVLQKKFCNTFVESLKEHKLQGSVNVTSVASIGVYNKGIAVKILPDNIIYTDVKESDIHRIVDSTLIKGKTLVDLVLKAPVKQHRIALRNCGVINPESITQYVARDGYQALKKSLSMLSSQQVIDEIKASGLRGRGGGGFLTGMKWQFSYNIDAEQKYVICNADEGDPGAYMDRSMLEGDPHSIIEGMIIAGYAIKATQGYFYIRAEYPLAIERIENAIKQAYEYGLLGENVLGTDFKFDIEVRLGAGAFVCGEETALIASIEGKRGYPRPRPPYPAVKGLWDCPTLINNVETLANVAYIINNGSSVFASIGTEKSKGTKVFALTGKINNSGLVEVPMGTTIRDLVYNIGGGVPDGKKVKAVQTGGPSGGVIPEEFFDTPISYEKLSELGSIMGSGGLIVMDEDDCMIDIAKFYLDFCVEESCGKCSPCRIGGYQMLRILDRISKGKAELNDITKIKSIAIAMEKASLCGLGQTASNPVISTLNYFNDEYIEHILNKKCPAGKCSALLTFTILQEKCVRCGLCVKNCPVDAIRGSKVNGYKIDPKVCIKCGRCAEVCKFDAVEEC